MTAWAAMLEPARQVFRAPSYAVFTDLLTGWLLAPGRRTITAMIAVADPTGRRAHDAYHRFLRDGGWSMRRLWRVLAVHAVGAFAPTGVVSLDCDDTLFHKTGRQVAGAGVFRDAVRSTGRQVVYALGLNLVVVTLRVTPSWGGMPIAVPINARLHKKRDATTTAAHAAAMIGGTHRLASRPQLPPVCRRRLRLPGRRRPAPHPPHQPDAPRRRPIPTRTAAYRPPRPAPHQRRPATHPTRARRPGLHP